jgi:hypothetical protein
MNSSHIETYEATGEAVKNQDRLDARLLTQPFYSKTFQH